MNDEFYEVCTVLRTTTAIIIVTLDDHPRCVQYFCQALYKAVQTRRKAVVHTASAVQDTGPARAALAFKWNHIVQKYKEIPRTREALSAFDLAMISSDAEAANNPGELHLPLTPASSAVFGKPLLCEYSKQYMNTVFI